jgi:hypothetical protein
MQKNKLFSKKIGVILPSSFMMSGLLLAALITLFGCQKENITPKDEQPTFNENYQDGPHNTGAAYRASVEPVLFDPWQSGDAAFECNQAGGCGDFALKIDEWDENNGMNGEHTAPNGEPNTAASNIITITSSDGHTFTWTSEYEVCAVIVKGGPRANVYYYPEGSCGDTEMYAPVNNSGGNAAISHVTFCWTDTPCDEAPNACYQEETAWSDGPRYKQRGNWATYTPYPGDGGVVEIFAGQTILAGSVTFSDNNDGTVDLTISLDNTFIFYYDLNDQVADENIKIQDYDNAPSGNPAPGQFDHKETANVGATSYTITVPLNNYYGIHLDVAYEVPCE